MMKSIKNIIKILVIMMVLFILLSPISVKAVIVPNEVLDNAADQAEKQVIEMFNEPIMGFLGENVSGIKIKQLLSTIKASNSKNEDHKVWVNSENNLPEVSEYKNSEKYNASVKAYDDKGYISIISIELSSSSSATLAPVTTPTASTTISPNSTQKTTPTPTITQSKLPQTGIEDYTWLIVAVIVLIGLAIFTYKKLKEYNDIK